MTPPLKPVPAIKNPGTAAAMIAVASSQAGYTEGPSNDTVFGKLYGLNLQPWCAMYVSWAAKVSGCSKAIPKHAYTPAGAAWFKARSQWGERPRVGAVVYFDTAGLGRISHVGIVAKVNGDGSFLSWEGNTNRAGSREGNTVRLQRRRTVGRRGGFGYPRYAKAPATPVENPPVNLANVARKARASDRYDGRVAAALAKEGLTPDRAGYADWQRRLGYGGADADGVAGAASLRALGAKHGWEIAE